MFMETGHKFPYKWTLADAVFTKDKGTVFSCFACGGGSTMGYKLAGFDVIGCNEIDPRMMAAYIANHHPKYSYLEPIQTFKDRQDLPDELFNLDILDGSPPCSSFSMLGVRERDWGKEKKFEEGQSKQVLDTLFFDFIDLAKRLQPKVVVAENVKGIIQGNAKSYAANVRQELEGAGYHVLRFLLDAADMGIPQRRERVFFIGLRKDLAAPFLHKPDMFYMVPRLDLSFKEKWVTFGEIFDAQDMTNNLEPAKIALWNKRREGDLDLAEVNGRENNKPKTHFSSKFIYNHKVGNTITTDNYCVLFERPRYPNLSEMLCQGSFPSDYDFLGIKPEQVIGMSVPPVMTAQIASRIWEQWLSRL